MNGVEVAVALNRDDLTAMDPDVLHGVPDTLLLLNVYLKGEPFVDPVGDEPFDLA